MPWIIFSSYDNILGRGLKSTYRYTCTYKTKTEILIIFPQFLHNFLNSAGSSHVLSLNVCLEVQQS